MNIIKKTASNSIFSELDLLWFQTWEPELFYLIVKQFGKRHTPYCSVEKFESYNAYIEHCEYWEEDPENPYGMVFCDTALSGVYLFDESFFF